MDKSKMRPQLLKYSYLFLLFIVFVNNHKLSKAADDGAFNDNEFAEFETDENILKVDNNGNEERENDPKDKLHVAPKTVKTEEMTNSDDFSFLADEEEIDHSEKSHDKPIDEQEAPKQTSKPGDIKPLTFADIPSHFRSNWTSYQVESIALLIIFIYILNYIYGKSKNHSLALTWFCDNQKSLERQFALVGDDGVTADDMGGHLIRETEFSYSIWSTGRVGCRGMLTQIKLCKRQDLLGVLLNIMRPKSDKLIHKIDLDRGEMDTFVIIFGQRKSVQKLVKETNDLAAYAIEKKNFEKVQVPSTFCVFAEIAETVPAIIDATTMQFLKKYERFVDYIHISDQYSGPKQQEDQYSRLPETHPTLIFSYILSDSDREVDDILLNFTFYMLEKVRQYRLSKEGKNRADKKRQNVQESFLKLTHQQRQEAAQTRREEKTRERKQRVMEEENPERQKRLEKMEQKRDAKLKQPKIKQFKIK